jgi:HSP20 family protein
VVELGAEVEAEDARATYQDGILRVELPLAQPEDRTRRVPIQRSEE